MRWSMIPISSTKLLTAMAAPDPAINFPFSYLSNSGTYRKVREAIAREIPAWNERFCSILWHPALKNTPENATSDFKASADITNAKNVRRLAAVCNSFASNAFQCFLPD
jgi:hypothetical protein